MMEAPGGQEILALAEGWLETFRMVVGRHTDPILWWQMCLRAAIVFVYAIALYRLMPRKAFGSSAIADIVVVVIMGSTLSRALTGNAPLLPALAATATLALLYVLFSVVTRLSDPLSDLVKGRSVLLIRDGTVDRRAMRRCKLGDGDLRENLRLQGISSLDQVRAAFVERNGEISVIRAEE